MINGLDNSLDIALMSATVQRAKIILVTADSSLAYNALRRWVWNVIDARRRDAELQEWHKLILHLAEERKIHGLGDDMAAKLETLADMLNESLHVAAGSLAGS